MPLDAEFPRTFSQERDPSLVEYLFVALGLTADLAVKLFKEAIAVQSYVFDVLVALLFGSMDDPYSPPDDALEVP